MNTRLMHTVQERVVQLYQTVLDRAPRETGRNYPVTKTRRTAPTTNIHVCPSIERFTASGVIFSDGRQADFDAVVLATGYRPRVDAFLQDAPGACDEAGAPRCSGEMAVMPSLCFCGYPVAAAGMLREIALEAQRSAPRSRRHARRHRLGSIPGQVHRGCSGGMHGVGRDSRDASSPASAVRSACCMPMALPAASGRLSGPPPAAMPHPCAGTARARGGAGRSPGRSPRPAHAGPPTCGWR